MRPEARVWRKVVRRMTQKKGRHPRLVRTTPGKRRVWKGNTPTEEAP